MDRISASALVRYIRAFDAHYKRAVSEHEDGLTNAIMQARAEVYADQVRLIDALEELEAEFGSVDDKERGAR